ncbi:MAG: hypothetical protein ACXWTS_08375 [Methylococcaceae bacterium]
MALQERVFYSAAFLVYQAKLMQVLLENNLVWIELDDALLLG